jgi:hypothetical protein
MNLNVKNPPPTLAGAVAAYRTLLRELRLARDGTHQRIAAIRANRDLSEEAKQREVAKQRAELVAFFDERFRGAVTRVAEATSIVEAAVERTANPDPFAPPAVDLSHATAGESALAALSRAAIAASASAASQVAAQRAEGLLAAAIAVDPVNGPAKLRRELADAGDRVLERAFDRVAPLRGLEPGARELLERAQGEIRDARLDAPLRELVGQTSELSGLTEFLVGIRAELTEGDFIESGKSAVLTGLALAYPGIAD